ncbi:MAB_1171c family putative transporter [Actinoplanes solisilvae]|uniref:MAB_1171c family putative transporter n=1 Tax=Actinoplanes solisilvae TaxID=2486853 RepID=UPI000FDAEA22|nr:MAB_1171c family putative transporter [Actinoplanes solisilvae]
MILAVALLVLLWGATIVRLPTLWRDRRQRALWTAVCAIALAKTVSFPPVAAHIETPILPHLLGVTSAYFLLRFIALVTHTGVRARQLALLLSVLAALIAFDVVAGGIDTEAELLAGEQGWGVVAYWVVLEAYLGTVLVTTSALFWRISREAPGGLPRVGLRVTSCGTALVACYAALKGSLILANNLGASVAFSVVEPIGMSVQTGGLILTVAGLLVPATRRARAAYAAYRSLIVLRPLWKAMQSAFPEVILFTPRRAVIELAGVDDVHLRLYRRVIEIRDGMLALRPFTAPHGPSPPEEAAAIVEALHRRADGQPPLDEPGVWAEVGPSMAEEVAWLSRVSRALGTPARTPTLSGSAR